ncbi:anti-sigma factor [Acidovorax sp. SRB_24]|uniref:anti-sigma factor family protein n=1 Tax=Acidovorax sp. SRB_24 TaxID=1962700 RepID=UPI00145E4BA7|nr:zf-HC2 domain-containing protein [Acidovorax sp. SRB_24]NMM77019.1 anti-sigma factor [Acidovorax sp. SRB_24]
MTCPQHHKLSVYADHQMPPAERARFDRHLQGCPLCQQRLNDIAALRNGLRKLPSPRLGFDLAAQLNDRLCAQPPGMRPAAGRWLGWVPAGLATGLALASGVWMGGLLLGAGAARAPSASLVRVFDPVPPGGLCAAAEICRLSKGMP